MNASRSAPELARTREVGVTGGPPRAGLTRQLGLLGLTATGICSMVGAAINVIPFMIHRTVPGIGPHVLTAFLIAAVPAVLAAMAYATLASAMPRAGGSYVYASRGLNPYLGFVASFSQWFGLSIAIGVVAYVLIFFLRDIAIALGWVGLAQAISSRALHPVVSLAILWTFVAVNLRGLKLYERTLVPLMFLMFALGAVVIVVGLLYNQGDFAEAVLRRDGRAVGAAPPAPVSLGTLLTASAILFSSFIGFDSIAQAGGEAKRPERMLPLAITLAIVVVTTYYLSFVAAVYHTVPWWFVAQEALVRDVTAPGLLGYVLAPGWTVLIVAGAATALTNDLPAMLLAVSRLMFAWAEDGIFPRAVASVHPTRHTPHIAIVLSGLMASLGILGSHFAGTFFLGVDILVTAMLVNFLIMCVTVLTLSSRNAELARAIRVVRQRGSQIILGSLGIVFLGLFLAVHTFRDLTQPANAWYFRATWLWLGVMLVGTVIYAAERRALRQRGVDVDARFRTLPPE
ncbi:MAG TPA: amino acid permease [Gemmatimonadaceae bacterium]|nr:amino acid permease [Gemmatimonadaceae bacterium]